MRPEMGKIRIRTAIGLALVCVVLLGASLAGAQRGGWGRGGTGTAYSGGTDSTGLSDSLAALRVVIGKKADSTGAATRTWTTNSIAPKPDSTRVNTLLGAKADSTGAATRTWTTNSIAPKMDSTRVNTLLGAKADSLGAQQDADTTRWDATKTDIKTLYRAFQFTIADPDALLGDSCIVWSNETGATVTLLGITAWSTTDNFDFVLMEYTNTGAAAGGTIEAVQITSNGTACFYTAEITSIDHATIEDGNTVWCVTTADSSAWLKVSVRYVVN